MINLKLPRVRCLAVVLAWVFLLFPTAAAFSADEKPSPWLSKDGFFTEAGFITGIGYGTVTEGNYLPVPLIVHLGTDTKRWFPSLREHRGILTAFMEPQFNLVTGKDCDVEGGVAFGMKYRYPVNDVLSLYGLVSLGILYITVTTVDQVNGFNFVDAIGVGVNYAIMPGAALDLGFRLRHVSNANFRDPNNGIDTYMGTIGFMISY